jgi:hypothetical protein
VGGYGLGKGESNAPDLISVRVLFWILKIGIFIIIQ